MHFFCVFVCEVNASMKNFLCVLIEKTRVRDSKNVNALTIKVN